MTTLYRIASGPGTGAVVVVIVVVIGFVALVRPPRTITITITTTMNQTVGAREESPSPDLPPGLSTPCIRPDNVRVPRTAADGTDSFNTLQTDRLTMTLKPPPHRGQRAPPRGLAWLMLPGLLALAGRTRRERRRG